MEEFEEIDFYTTEDENENEEEPEKNRIFHYLGIVVVVLVIIGLLNIFGLRNYFFYKITSPSSQQKDIETKINAEVLQVYLNIIVLTTTEERYGSKRDNKSVLSLVRNAGVIWKQGNIEFVIKNIYFEEKSGDLLSKLYHNPNLVLSNIKNLDDENINVLLVGNLDGINGVSFGKLNTVAVADYTTVYDFRVLAHEVGHSLGLSHVSESRGQLMYQGANGFNLTIEEIEIVRDNLKVRGNK